jgi:hypothetical protein
MKRSSRSSAATSRRSNPNPGIWYDSTTNLAVAYRQPQVAEDRRVILAGVAGTLRLSVDLAF